MKLICFILGYLCGNVLTAEFVAKKFTGKKAGEIGTGNPGMANIMAEAGKKAGLSNFTMCFLVLVFNEEGILLRCPWKVDSVAPDTDSGGPVLAGREASAKLFGGPAGTFLRIMLF